MQRHVLFHAAYNPYVSICQHMSACQHTSAYVSIRQHTSAYVSIQRLLLHRHRLAVHTSAYRSIQQHTSAYVSIRQHTTRLAVASNDIACSVSSIAYVRIRQCTSAYDAPGCCLKRHRLQRVLNSALLTACLHTSAYVSISQQTSAYVT